MTENCGQHGLVNLISDFVSASTVHPTSPQISLLKHDFSYGFKPGLGQSYSSGQFRSLPSQSEAELGQKLQFGDQHGKMRKEVVSLVRRPGVEGMILNTGGAVSRAEWGGGDTNNNGNKTPINR